MCEVEGELANAIPGILKTGHRVHLIRETISAKRRPLLYVGEVAPDSPLDRLFRDGIARNHLLRALEKIAPTKRNEWRTRPSWEDEEPGVSDQRHIRH